MIFSNQDLKKLIIPLVIEQLLSITVGLADTLMVSRIGEAAVSAVSIVDQINILLINIFAALGTGGAVLTSQYLGQKNYEGARSSAKQLIMVTAVISSVIMLLALAFNSFILSGIYGSIEADVMNNAKTYFYLTALSFPFIALYNGGAALFRAIGNSRISMNNSLIMNAINITLNAIFIYGFNLSVFGAALATLIARTVACVVTLKKLTVRNNGDFYIDNYHSWHIEIDNISKILTVGIPSGFENGLFQLGKLLVASLITTFGTYAIAANAVCNNFFQLQYMPAAAIGTAMLTVISRCVGADDYQQAKYYIRKLMGYAYLAMILGSVCIFIAMPFILPLYNLSELSLSLARTCIIYHLIVTALIWPIGFAFPNCLKGAADVRFTMVVSVASMMIFRVGGSYILGKYFNLGLIGVFTAMFIDWVCRVIFFIARYRSGKWMNRKLV